MNHVLTDKKNKFFTPSPISSPPSKGRGEACLPAGRGEGVYVHFSPFFSLTKPRLVSMVLLSTMVGFWLGLPSGWDLFLSLHVLLGTALTAGGAMAVNQFLERETDARMIRTQDRPIVTGEVKPAHALFFGISITILGLIWLLWFVNLASALLAAATSVSYLFLYTPLKRKTPMAVTVGAVPGALPPLIGWAAATGTVSSAGIILFLIIFFWQMPHFLAIGWIYRSDYERAGLSMLSVLDREGHAVAREMITHTCALIPASLLPTIFGLTGTVYFFGAFLLGLGFSAAIIFAAANLDSRARYVFRASIIYLTLLLILMVIDKI